MNQNDVAIVGMQMKGEVQSDAKAVARDLFGNVPPGMSTISTAEQTAMDQRQWTNPGYAESVRNNVGDEEFLDRAAAIGMAPKDWRKQLPTA